MGRAKPVDWDTPFCYSAGKYATPVDLLVMHLSSDMVRAIENKPSTYSEQSGKKDAINELLAHLKGYGVENISETAIQSKFKLLKKKLQDAQAWRESTGAGILDEAAEDDEEARNSINGKGQSLHR